MATVRGMHVRERIGKTGMRSLQIIIEQPPCPETGKRRRITKTAPSGTTKKQAEKIGMQMLQDLETDSYVKITTLTVGQFLREWHETYIAPHKSPVTAATYLYNLDNYLLPRFGKLRLQSLTTIEIQRWVNELATKSPLSDNPLHPKTIRNLYLNLCSALKRAVILGYLTKNPALNIELPKGKPYKPDVYSADELQTLFEVVKGTDLELSVMILVCLGIRRGELMALTWADVDLDNRLVNIDKSTVRIKTGVILTKDPKSEASKRIINAPDVLIDFLRREKVEYFKRKLRLGKDYHDHDLIICQPNGQPYTPDYFTHKFKRMLESNGLKRIRLHDLRHSHATFMLKMGVNVKAIQKSLGHSNYNTTMDIYSHVLEDMGREAADTLNAGLQGIVANSAPVARVKMF